MAVTYIGAASAGATSLTLPTHQAGDLILIAAYTSGATAPTIPSTVCPIKTVQNTSRRLAVGYIQATSSSMTSGTWTNATVMAAAVYRSNSGRYLSVGSHTVSSASNTAISYTTLTFSDNPNAWAVGIAGTPTDLATDTPPAGMTNRTNLFSTNEIALHDTNGNVSSWPTTTVTITSSPWAAFTCEINETFVSLPSASGGVPLIGPGGLVY